MDVIFRGKKVAVEHEEFVGFDGLPVAGEAGMKAPIVRASTRTGDYCFYNAWSTTRQIYDEAEIRDFAARGLLTLIQPQRYIKMTVFPDAVAIYVPLNEFLRPGEEGPFWHHNTPHGYSVAFVTRTEARAIFDRWRVRAESIAGFCRAALGISPELPVGVPLEAAGAQSRTEAQTQLLYAVTVALMDSPSFKVGAPLDEVARDVVANELRLLGGAK